MYQDHHFNPVLQLAYGQMQQEQFFRDIANNPALPPMLKQSFEQLAMHMQMYSRPLMDMHSNLVMDGQGPACRAAAASAKVLGLEEERAAQLKDLAVRRDFREAPRTDQGDPYRELLTRRLSRLFEKTYPYTLFASSEVDQNIYQMEHQGCSVEIKVNGESLRKADIQYTDPAFDEEHRYRIKSIDVTIWSPNKYWFITQIMSPHVMFSHVHTMNVNAASAFHMLECHSGNISLVHHEEFWHAVLDRICEPLELVFVDYEYAHETWQQVVDSVVNRFEWVHEEDKHAILSKLFSLCQNYNRRDNIKGVVIPCSFGDVSIYTDHSDCWSYDKLVEKLKKDHWARERKTFKVEQVAINGWDCASRSARIPLEYMEEFKTKFSEWANAIVQELNLPDRSETEV